MASRKSYERDTIPLHAQKFIPQFNCGMNKMNHIVFARSAI